MRLARFFLLLFLCRFAVVAQTTENVTNAILVDFSGMATTADTGFDNFSGNIGLVSKDNQPYASWLIGRTANGPAATFWWDFTVQTDPGAYTGAFFSLFGLIDKQNVTFDATTPVTESYSEHSLNLNRVDSPMIEPGGDRKYLTLGMSVLYQGSQPLNLRLELHDANGGGRFTRLSVTPSALAKQLSWDFRDPAKFTSLGTDLDLTQAKVFSFVVERANQAPGMDAGTLVLNSIWFVPDRSEVEPTGDAALLDLAERRSCQYFLDWSSRKSGSLGIPQDRSTFADLLTAGGIGFALPCYAIAAERGWISRPDAASRSLAVLQVLSDPSHFCADPVGCIGYRGWLYHFLGSDGRRKQNYNSPGNTVEVSTIDTALALMGALVAQSYFDQGASDEGSIRTLAQQFYDNVDWEFMLPEPHWSPTVARESRQFFLGWKPIKDSGGSFQYPDREGKGKYSGTATTPAVLDYYTDEGFLVTLLAIGSRTQTVGTDVYCAWYRQRDQSGLIRTWPGSLFTYFFTRAFFATEQYDLRPCPDEPPVKWLENSRQAFWEAIAALPAGV